MTENKLLLLKFTFIYRKIHINKAVNEKVKASVYRGTSTVDGYRWLAPHYNTLEPFLFLRTIYLILFIPNFPNFHKGD